MPTSLKFTLYSTRIQMKPCLTLSVPNNIFVVGKKTEYLNIDLEKLIEKSNNHFWNTKILFDTANLKKGFQMIFIYYLH